MSAVPRQPPPTSTPASTDLEWNEAGSFGEGETFEFASAVVRGAGGFVAVGTHYDQPLDPSGPLPPHEGRVWVSPDGRSWTDVTPLDTFAHAVMEHVFTTMDGSIIAIGKITNPDSLGGEILEPLAAWLSADGRSWHRTEIGLPDELVVQEVEHGARGYLAVLRPQFPASNRSPQLWFSADGWTWEREYVVVGDERANVDVAAGDEGFVAVGNRTRDDVAEGFAVASSDGRTWIESPSESTDGFFVAPMGPDWIAMGQGSHLEDRSAVDETAIWFSANGLDWSPLDEFLLKGIELDDVSVCFEFVANLISADGWLLAGTSLSYPCSEGGVVGYGAQRISVDGTAWKPLPFARFSYTNPPRIREDGSIVLDGAGADGGLVLVGQSNGRATFWFGESR